MFVICVALHSIFFLCVHRPGICFWGPVVLHISFLMSGCIVITHCYIFNKLFFIRFVLQRILYLKASFCLGCSHLFTCINTVHRCYIYLVYTRISICFIIFLVLHDQLDYWFLKIYKTTAIWMIDGYVLLIISLNINVPNISAPIGCLLHCSQLCILDILQWLELFTRLNKNM